MDIDGISDPYSIKNFIQCSPEVHYTGLTLKSLVYKVDNGCRQTCRKYETSGNC